MKAWRDSASLLLAARHRLSPKQTTSPNIFHYDYNLMTLKRSQNASFMPGAYVFPGGTTESADADLKWNKLFAAFGFENSLKSLISNTSNRPPIFKQKANELPREISLRITAIRETFEECGVLLCKRLTKPGFLKEWAQNLSIPNGELEVWQNKIHDDPSEFYKMCERLNCYPDLWALHEWSNWLTPTTFPGKRFDTIFYLACLPSVPEAKFEETEMEGLEWSDPKTMINSGSKFMMFPPQHYELARIAKFENLDNLLDFAVERSKIGVQLNFPIMVKLSDGMVNLLPGDSMYPKEVDFVEKRVIDQSQMTIIEFRDISPVKNRIELCNFEVKNVVVDNLENTDGHLTPLPLQSISVKPSKL